MGDAILATRDTICDVLRDHKPQNIVLVLRQPHRGCFCIPANVDPAGQGSRCDDFCPACGYGVETTNCDHDCADPPNRWYPSVGAFRIEAGPGAERLAAKCLRAGVTCEVVEMGGDAA